MKTIVLEASAGICCCGPGGGGCDPAATTFSAVGYNSRTYTKYTDATVPDLSTSPATDFDGAFGGASISNEVWYSDTDGIEEWVWVEDDQDGCGDTAGVHYRTYGYDTGTSSALNSTADCCDNIWNPTTGRYETTGDMAPECVP